MLGRLYLRFWYATEFWLTRTDRRPYTFIMRDWIFSHHRLTIALIIIWYGGLIALSPSHPLASLILGALSSFLLAHLVWGSAYIEHQQEYPEYLGD